MSRVLALIDGEHYPPVVRAALSKLAERHTVLAAVFLGGTEKIDLAAGADSYGVPLVSAPTATGALGEALSEYAVDAVVDLSDEPVVSSADRFVLANLALERGVVYEGPGFRFEPPSVDFVPHTASLGVIGTGKRVGKTALSADLARVLKAGGFDPVVLAMGRGGPAEPELLRGDEVALTTEDLLGFARLGRHASSDNYEDAVMSRVTTVGCRRCGGGMAGDTYFDNVAEGARLADSLGRPLMVLEGSGAAIPPVHADANLLVIGAARGAGYVRDYFGPLRLSRADFVVVAGADDALVSAAEVALVREAVTDLRPDVPIATVTFRPRPIEPVAGKRVFFATTAPERLVPSLAEHLSAEHGCTVVGTSAHLSDRAKLRADLGAAAGTFDVLLTELKAAAIDVVALAGEEAGVPTVLCDNVPVATDSTDLAEQYRRLARLAHERCEARGGA